MFSNRKIDHIVYAVPNLETAMNDLEKLLGVRPIFGGYHTLQGTKNAVLNLGNKCYLEIIAIDFENESIQSPRWMGVDFIEIPTITRWCLKSNDLEKDSQVLKKYVAKMGTIQEGQRKMSDGNLLTWKMIMPLASPTVEFIPFMVDWQYSKIHPTEKMPEVCVLKELNFTHPNPQTLKPIFEGLSLNLNIQKGEKVRISLKIKCPNGIVNI